MGNNVSTVLGEVAAWAADPGTPSPAAVDNAKRGIADLVGVALAARDTELAAILGRVYSLTGESGPSVIGYGRAPSPQIAAFCNAVLGHALDFDDSNSDVGGHPSTVVLPAALAVAEGLGRSGAELLSAYMVGVEVVAALGRALNPAHYDSGWHPTATLGAFGAAAAASRLLGLAPAQIAEALGLTVAFCAGVKVSFGTSAKPLQVGNAAMSGVAAAELIAAGASAPSHAFEGAQGFLAVLQRTADVPAITLPGRDGTPWSLASPGIIIKRYPCCGSTHAAADAALELRGQWGDQPIDAVRIGLHPKRRGHVDRAHPASGAEAKFSVQYVVARALLEGAVTLHDFSDAALREPRIASVMGATTVFDLDVPDERVEDRYVAEVTVEGGGRSTSLRLPMAVGRQRDMPLAWGAVRDKFDQCSAHVTSRRRDELWRYIRSLDALPDVGSLAALLRDDTATVR